MAFGIGKSGQSALLNKEQKKVISGINKLEKSGHSDLKETAIERIAEEVLRPNHPNLSDKELNRRAEMVYQSCKHTLRNSPLTTNVSATLFMNDGFYNSDELETLWTIPTNKGFRYFETRQTVEQGVFGYKIDWSVPISVAARNRPAYAGLNYSSHPFGAAVAYGSTALFLKSAVKPRCTFIATDTFDVKFDLSGGDANKAAAARAQMTTMARIGNLCATLSKNQLRVLCAVASSSYTCTDDPPNYIEAHLHGSIRWDRDLDHIRIAAGGENSYTRELARTNRNPNAFKLLVTAWAQRYQVRASIWDNNQEIEVLNA